MENTVGGNMIHLVGKNGEHKTPKLKVAICIPTRGQNPWGFTYDLAQMMLCTGIAMVSRGLLDIGLISTDGTYIASNREDLVLSALEGYPTHLLWLDDDMRFPQDLLIRLLKHNKPIVAVNYAMRKTPCIPVTIKRLSDTKGQPATRLITTPESSGLEQVEAIGFGAALIRANVFHRIPRPWFENYWNTKVDRWIGEDIDFCRKCEKAGIEILVDHDLSKEIGHVGTFEYTLAHAQAWDETYGDNNGRPQTDQPVHAVPEDPKDESLHQG